MLQSLFLAAFLVYCFTPFTLTACVILGSSGTALAWLWMPWVGALLIGTAVALVLLWTFGAWVFGGDFQ